MIRIEDFGEIGYGGAVTWSRWWDNKRIDEGKITDRDFFMKATTYTYLGIGLAATLMSVFGWMKRWERWGEHISHGFFYDLPRFAWDISQTMGAGRRSRSDSTAVQEAQRILREKSSAAKLLASGRTTERSYQPEMEQAIAF